MKPSEVTVPDWVSELDESDELEEGGAGLDGRGGCTGCGAGWGGVRTTG